MTSETYFKKLQDLRREDHTLGINQLDRDGIIVGPTYIVKSFVGIENVKHENPAYRLRAGTTVAAEVIVDAKLSYKEQMELIEEQFDAQIDSVIAEAKENLLGFLENRLLMAREKNS